MVKEILDFFEVELGQQLNDVAKNRDRNISVFGLFEGQKVVLSNALSQSKTVLYVCDDYFVANKIYEQFSNINSSVVNLPSIDDVLIERRYNNFNSQQRLNALHKIVQGVKIVVTTVASCLQPCADLEQFKSRVFKIAIGGNYCVDDICSTLVDNGYSRVDSVTESGQFCWRGNIVDIWGAGEQVPFRLDFFGDDLESIKQFDPESRLSQVSLQDVSVAPNFECGAMRLKNFVGDCVVVFDEVRDVSNALQRVLQEHANRLSNLLLSNQIAKDLVINLFEDGLEFDCRKIAFHRDLSQNRLFNPDKIFKIDSFAISDYNRNFEGLVYDLSKWINLGFSVNLCASNDAQAGILSKLVATHKFAKVSVVKSGLLRGAVLGNQIFVGQQELFKKVVKQIKKSNSQLFSQISPGDYVVHVVHGIGKYERAEKLDLSGTPRDYLIVKYKNDDTLYVPVESIDNLSKYSSNSQPNLNSIGGQEFEKVKQRVKQGVRKMALDLLALYAQREQSKGVKYNVDEKALMEFENAFEHLPTDCQVAASKDVVGDLKKGIVMDRLLCGDVGYGKTEVAMRAAYCAVMDGKQVAFVCPTTILAKQHAKSVRKRMSQFGIQIAEFSRFESAKQITQNLDKLATGQVDIAIGTHRLLQKDVVFKQLGILVLDEEQRFGVADKEKIKRLKTDVNVLTLSATPIPRTLHMSLQSIRDISILDTPPKARLPVQTYVSEYSESLIKDAILRELGRGGAAFVVYNNVSDMPRFVSQLQELLPSANVVMAHGQQKSQTMEDAVQKFVDGQANVLVASTIIENGIDMPHANTMVVLDSDRLGLAQMYQLRGRVGRSERQAYCYFTYDKLREITPQAFKRLDAITEFTEFGSGFKLAMRDLEIRGAGNVLGREQHGHMDKVGYDMYCKLLSETVSELRGDKVSAYRETKVVTDMPCYVPDEYVQDKQAKLDVYGRITSLYAVRDREVLYDELSNIYGPPPKSVSNLLTMGLFKNLANKLGASQMVLDTNKFSVSFDKVKDISADLAKIVGASRIINTSAKPTVQFKDAKEMLKILIAANETK